MRIGPMLLLAVACVPLLEIYLLVKVGKVVGAVPTVGLVVLTAVLGVALVRYQGIHTLARVGARLDAGELPALDLVEGLLLLAAGLLLLTPGFFTDAIGFLLLVPAVRRRLAAVLLRRVFARDARYRNRRTVIVEGEFWEEEETGRIARRDPGADGSLPPERGEEEGER